jgi:hypothetical protein
MPLKWKFKSSFIGFLYWCNSQMQEDSIITNILSIAGAGLLILLTGLSFLFFRDFISKNIRYFLPIPPIGVAAYIYVFNLYQHNNGDFTGRLTGTIKEILLSVGIISFTFATFVVLLILFIGTFRKFV